LGFKRLYSIIFIHWDGGQGESREIEMIYVLKVVEITEAI